MPCLVEKKHVEMPINLTKAAEEIDGKEGSLVLRCILNFAFTASMNLTQTVPVMLPL